MIQIIENDEVNLVYDPSKEQLRSTYIGFVKSANFRNAIDTIKDSSAKYKVRSLLVNSLNQGALSPEDNQYASSFLPVLSANGMKYMAFVMPQKVITALGVKKFIRLNDSDVRIGHFTGLQEAEEWLLKENSSE